MDSDPDAITFVGEDVDVVVARSNRSELCLGLLVERTSCFKIPTILRFIQYRAVNALRVLTADAEADPVRHFVHDPADVGTQIRACHIKADRLVAAADVISDTGRA